VRQRGLDFGTPVPQPARGAERRAAPPRPATERRGWSVSELTERVQGLLETELNDVWVEGEVSNLRPHSSGHWYFSLKDDKAQVRAVVCARRVRLLRFRPKDGMKVLVRGRLSVYAARGEYQLDVELVEPLGKGSLQQAFEELKQRLQQEGLFDPARKRALPLLPRRIGVVTSPTGAVIRDILRVLRGRYANLEVLLYPARVQGAGAAAEIVAGIRALNQVARLDVLIVARGGGSLEDLWAFNEEAVARALAASRLPTISAVGHETDYTIADFVADVRAPTPSAAAEQVVQAKQDLQARVTALEGRLTSGLRLRLAAVRRRVEAMTSHRVFEAERGRLRLYARGVEERLARAAAALRSAGRQAGEALERTERALAGFRWDRQLAERGERVAALESRLVERLRGRVAEGRGGLGRLAGKLDSLSPVAVLGRGYALVFREAAGATPARLLRHPDEVAVGDPLRIRVAGGGLGAVVTDKESA